MSEPLAPGGAAKRGRSGKPAKTKWRAELNPFFRSRDVTVVPDNDDAGRDHARAVAANLASVAARVRILELASAPAAAVRSAMATRSTSATGTVFISITSNVCCNTASAGAALRHGRWWRSGCDRRRHAVSRRHHYPMACPVNAGADVIPGFS
jgi:hypothetical protein